jgi:hypothetical protein
MKIKIVKPEITEEEALNYTAEELAEYKKSVFEVLQQGYQTQNYVRVITVAPDLVEEVKSWIPEYDLPEIVSTLLTVEAGETDEPLAGLISQAQIESMWLNSYYQSHPVTEILREMKSPLILGYQDFKFLYLLDLWATSRAATAPSKSASTLWTPT